MRGHGYVLSYQASRECFIMQATAQNGKPDFPATIVIDASLPRHVEAQLHSCHYHAHVYRLLRKNLQHTQCLQIDSG